MKRHAIIGVLAGIILIGGTGCDDSKKQKIVCSANMRTLGMHIKMYGPDFNDMLPAQNLAILEKEGFCTDPTVYICPKSGKEYAYVGAGLSDNSGTFDLPIAFDFPRNHDKDINVLFGGRRC